MGALKLTVRWAKLLLRTAQWPGCSCGGCGELVGSGTERRELNKGLELECYVRATATGKEVATMMFLSLVVRSAC